MEMAGLIVAYTIPILDVDIEQAKRMYDVNVWGVIRTTQVFSGLVIAAEGTIVTIGSIAGVMPYAFGGTIPPSQPPSPSLFECNERFRSVQLQQSSGPRHRRRSPNRNVPLQRKSPQLCHRRRAH